MLAIIGGSGLTRLSTLAVAHREVVRTPYGDPSSALLFGQIGGRDAVFLARHGHGHTIPPHRVNYRANLWALREKGATAVVAVASVGGIRGVPARRSRAPAPAHRLHLRPRRDVLRRRRPQRRAHRLHASVHAGAARARASPRRALAGIPVTDGGVYGAVNGPRLETAAEIDRMDRDGVTLVGMTGMPEAALAREAGLPYCAICVVVNHAAGRGDSATQVSMEGIAQVLESAHGARARAARPRRAARRRRGGPGRAVIRDILRMGDPRLLERSREVERLRHARTRGAARRHARHDARARRRRPRRAADRRAAARRDLRRRAQSRAIRTPSRCPTPNSSIRC